MNNYNIVLTVRNKVPFQTDGTRYLVCDNADYTLTLDLDEEWYQFGTKTVLFILPDGGTIPVLTDGDECRIPVIQKPGTLLIGITAGEEMRTSRELEIVVKNSIRTLADDVAKQVAPDLTQQIVARLDNQESRIKRIEANGGVGGEGSGGGTYFTTGNALELTEDGVLNVKTTNEAEEDNTLPITSAGVYTVVGNIGALLDTI